MQATKIDWPWKPLFVWNVITGCKRDCKWGNGGCYAKQLWNFRFREKTGHEFTDIIYHPEKLKEPMVRKKPTNIFVNSMSDPEYWTPVHVRSVLTVCRDCPQHTFIFLSKNPQSYDGWTWPDNTMQGLTLTCSTTTNTYWMKQSDAIAKISKYNRPFLSIEPLLGMLMVDVPDNVERVIVGAMTGPGAVPVRPEWIQSIKDHVPAEKIFWKSSITAKKDRGKL